MGRTDFRAVRAPESRSYKDQTLTLLSAISHDDHPDFSCLPNDPQIEVTPEQTSPRVVAASAEEYLGNLIAARKIYDGIGRIVAIQDSRFDVQVSRKVQVLFNSAPVLVGEPSFTLLWHNGDCKAICTEIIGHSAVAPDEHTDRSACTDTDQDPINVLSLPVKRSGGVMLRLPVFWRGGQKGNQGHPVLRFGASESPNGRNEKEIEV